MKKSAKKLSKAEVNCQKVADWPIGESARRIVSCGRLFNMVETIKGLSPEEMRSALLDLGVCVAAQHQAERRA